MITLTKTINKLPENPLLKTNKGEHRFEMNIKTRTGNHQQATPRAPPFYHFLGARGSCLVPFRYRRSVYCRPDLWQEGLRECIHKDGGACKRKLPSNVERLRCIGCGFEKVEHAFPRAQLKPRAEERRNCIACLKNVSELTCSQCAEVKPLKEFHLSALTLPWAAACQSCQDAVRGKARRLRAGWEKCRGCAAFLPTSSAVYINQRCPNCAADRKRGERTCLRCKRKWSENSAEEQIRKRFCPNCRQGRSWRAILNEGGKKQMRDWVLPCWRAAQQFECDIPSIARLFDLLAHQLQNAWGRVGPALCFRDVAKARRAR